VCASKNQQGGNEQLS